MARERKRCFVISPIGIEDSDVRRHADAVLEFIINRAIAMFADAREDLEIETVRSDEIADSGSISRRMFQELSHADLCFAVLTGHNPNVYYELAVAQCAARPVIMLIEKGQHLPFDVQDLRCVEYELGDICQLVEGKYAKRVLEHVEAIDRQGWISKSLFELQGFGRQQRFEQMLRGLVRKARPQPLEMGIDAVYRLPADGRELVILTGDVIRLANLEPELLDRDPDLGAAIDVIVSLEDVNLQLARYFEASMPGAISGTLRYLFAQKSDISGIERDSLYENLQEALAREDLTPPAPLGTVIPTPTGGPENGTRYVFHVAAMTGTVGDGYAMMDDLIDDCVRNVYRRFGTLAEEQGLHTILFPLLGAASTRLEPEEVAHRLLEPIVRQMKRFASCRRTYVLAWLEAHRLALARAAHALVDRGALELGTPAA